jgi:hypothetical protein
MGLKDNIKKHLQRNRLSNGRWTELPQDEVQSLSLAAAALNFRTLPSELVTSGAVPRLV